MNLRLFFADGLGNNGDLIVLGLWLLLVLIFTALTLDAEGAGKPGSSAGSGKTPLRGRPGADIDASGLLQVVLHPAG